MSNYPPGMSSRDWDHVWGVSRCANCGAELPEEIVCKACGSSGVTPPDRFGNRDPCPECEEAREKLREGYCPDYCMDEPDADRERDEAWHEERYG